MSLLDTSEIPEKQHPSQVQFAFQTDLKVKTFVTLCFGACNDAEHDDDGDDDAKDMVMICNVMMMAMFMFILYTYYIGMLKPVMGLINTSIMSQLVCVVQSVIM